MYEHCALRVGKNSYIITTERLELGVKQHTCVYTVHGALLPVCLHSLVQRPAPDYEKTLPQSRGFTFAEWGLAIPCGSMGNSSKESRPIREDMRLNEVKTGV